MLAQLFQRHGRLAAWSAILMFLPYLTLVTMFAAFQRSLIYHPSRSTALTSDQSNLPPGRTHSWTVTADDNLVLHGWLILAESRAVADLSAAEKELEAGRPLILFFCGNGGNRSFRTADYRALTSLGADLVVFDYRGYGDNAGEPSAAEIAADARTIWKFLTVERHVSPQRIVLYGESLGGAVAAQLAFDLCHAGTPPAGLILRSTFASLAEAGSYHYPWLPVRWFLLDKFASRDRIPEVTCPILMLHGEQDHIVPFAMGQQLFAAAPEKSDSGVAKQFVALPNADHNDVMETEIWRFQEVVGKFLKTIVAAPG